MIIKKFSNNTLKQREPSNNSPPMVESISKDVYTHTSQTQALPVNLSNDSKAEVVTLVAKNVHKGALIGHVSNGNGQIPLSDKLSIRFVALNEDFSRIEINVHGSTPKYQKWQKVKKVKEEKPKAPEINNQGQVKL